jgi:hypothetical protein
MNMHHAALSPQRATPDPGARGIPIPLRIRVRAAGAAAAALILAAAFAACSSTASSIPSVAIPSINASAAASLGMQAALTALNDVDAAISANETSGGLTADNATSLKALAGSIRTALQTGDASAARTAVDQFSTKLGEMASTLNGDAGKQLQDAAAALKAAVAGS